MKRLSEFFTKVHDWSLRHWIYSTLLSTLPAIWFTVMQISGKQLKLINNEGEVHGFSLIFFWILILVSFFYSLVLAYKESDKARKMINAHILLDKVGSSIDKVCAKKTERFIDYIRQNSKKTITSPFHEITKPKIQVDILIDELNLCLSEILGMKRNEIGISIIYKKDGDRKWEWLHKIHLSNKTNIRDITDDPSSTARQIIDGKSRYLLIPSKSKAISDGSYKSKSNDTPGSIICRDISVEFDGHKYLNAILSITTYGKEICNADTLEIVKENLNVLLTSFETRLKLELSLLYIKSCVQSNTQSVV